MITRRSTVSMGPSTTEERNSVAAASELSQLAAMKREIPMSNMEFMELQEDSEPGLLQRLQVQV